MHDHPKGAGDECFLACVYFATSDGEEVPERPLLEDFDEQMTPELREAN
jgi:hypothetical protein